MKGQNKMQAIQRSWAAVDGPALCVWDAMCGGYLHTHTTGCHTAGTCRIKISFPKNIY